MQEKEKSTSLKKKNVEEAKQRLKMASKLLDERQISLKRFLQMLDPAGEWFPKTQNLALSSRRKMWKETQLSH